MNNDPLYKNRDWLHEHYIVLRESTYVMAREANCSYVTIWKWLHRFDIPTRTRSEATFLAKRNYLTISRELLDLLEGELLGDGCVVMTGSRSAVYAHTSKYEEYLIWLSKTFAGLGLEQVGKIGKHWSEEYETFGYKYASKSYPELVSLRHRFYLDRKKIVPQDLILTPIMARQWYIGDGSLHNNARGRPEMIFYTCDFDKPSIDYLLEELRNKGFRVSHQLASNSIGISTYSTKDFLSWIGPCPAEIQDIYGYKWDYQDNRKGAR